MVSSLWMLKHEPCATSQPNGAKDLRSACVPGGRNGGNRLREQNNFGAFGGTTAGVSADL